MDIVIEILLEIYMELMLLVVPEKNIGKKHIRIVKLTTIGVVLGVFALAVWGIMLIVDHNNLWGIVPIAIAIILSLIQIIAGIILFEMHHGKGE